MYILLSCTWHILVNMITSLSDPLAIKKLFIHNLSPELKNIYEMNYIRKYPESNSKKSNKVTVQRPVVLGLAISVSASLKTS